MTEQNNRGLSIKWDQVSLAAQIAVAQGKVNKEMLSELSQFTSMLNSLTAATSEAAQAAAQSTVQSGIAEGIGFGAEGVGMASGMIGSMAAGKSAKAELDGIQRNIEDVDKEGNPTGSVHEQNTGQPISSDELQAKKNAALIKKEKLLRERSDVKGKWKTYTEAASTMPQALGKVGHGIASINKSAQDGTRVVAQAAQQISEQTAKSTDAVRDSLKQIAAQVVQNNPYEVESAQTR